MMKFLASFLFSFLLLNAFFLRRPWLFSNITGSLLAIFSLIVILGLIAFYFLKSNKTPNISGPLRSIFHFFVLSILFAIMQASELIYRGDLIFSYSVQYVIDLLICLGFVLASYYLVRMNLVNFRIPVIALSFFGLCVSLSNISSALSLTRLRRFNDGLAAVNYQGNTLAIAAICSLFLVLDSDTLRIKSGFQSIIIRLCLTASYICCSLAVFLSGSRQAIASLVFGSLLILFYSFCHVKFVTASEKNRQSSLVLLICFTILLLAFLPSQATSKFQKLDASNLVKRLSTDDVISTFENRVRNRFIDQGLSVVTNNPLDLLFGNPTLYHLIARESETVQHTTYHPHNIFLSIYLYSGIPALILFVRAIYLTTIDFYRLTRIRFSLNKKNAALQYSEYSQFHLDRWKQINVILSYSLVLYISFILVLIYLFFSGNYTRTFSLFILWGILLGSMHKAKSAIASCSS